jgi:hypothetical protein
VISSGFTLFQGRSIVVFDADKRLVVFELPSGKVLYRSDPTDIPEGWALSRDQRLLQLLTARGYELHRMPDVLPVKDWP